MGRSSTRDDCASERVLQEELPVEESREESRVFWGWGRRCSDGRLVLSVEIFGRDRYVGIKEGRWCSGVCRVHDASSQW